MASTFTLKRKTYTEFDYRNDIAATGFSDGMNYAVEKMYTHPTIEKMLRIASKHRSAYSWAGSGDKEEIFRRYMKKGGKLPKDMEESFQYARNEVNRTSPGELDKFYKSFKNGGGQMTNTTVKSEFPSRGGNNPSAPALQQRAASFIGKGYLY
jgi:hypothetical protein